MKVEGAIKKAIEGGYRYFGLDWSNPRKLKLANDGHKLTGWNIDMRTEVPWSGRLCEDFRRVASDPHFWQSLGKALEWKPEVVIECACGRKERKKIFLYHWHRFIDHLADGKTAEEFFEAL